jgi:hypothetical protein
MVASCEEMIALTLGEGGGPAKKGFLIPLCSKKITSISALTKQIFSI